MKTFPLPYSFRDGVNKDITYATTEVSFASGKKQVRRHAKRPMIKYKIECKGSNEQREILERFYDDMGGNTDVFYFVNPDGLRIVARFSSPTLSPKLITEYAPDNPPTYARVVGFTCDITVETVL